MGVDDQVDRVDRFLASGAKVLEDYQPHWVHMAGYRDYQLSWPILEEDTGRTRANLRFRIPDSDFRYPSISLILSGAAICRVDRADPSVCKPNPPWAAALGLSPQVCGTHVHTWTDNRQFVLSRGVWEQPARRQIDAELADLDAMFFWFCGAINVRIQPHNRPIRLPDAGLFGRMQ